MICLSFFASCLRPYVRHYVDDVWSRCYSLPGFAPLFAVVRFFWRHAHAVESRLLDRSPASRSSLSCVARPTCDYLASSNDARNAYAMQCNAICAR